MKKQKRSNTTIRLKLAGVAVIAAALAAGTLLSPLAQADRFDEQIAELRAQNNQTQDDIDNLALEAQDLQSTIATLQNRIYALETQISNNKAERIRLIEEIKKAEAELEVQKDLLGQNIRAIYLEGDISTIEMLASSNNISDYLDKQEYRNVIQDKIKVTLDKINALKKQLAAEKQSVENLIAEDTALQAEVAVKKARQTELLNMNQAQQSEFNSQIAQNKEKIEELREQQIIANLAIFSGGVQPGIPGGGGYPWGNAYCVHTGQVGGACWNYDWYFNGGAWDSWGYGFRNCTSWVAYKLAMDNKSGFSYLGDANNWPSAAAARGFAVDYGKGARKGDAAVNPAGFYGHVMYVEAVLDDGRVVVSDYNRAGDGYYRGPDSGNASVVNQSSLVFIHF